MNNAIYLYAGLMTDDGQTSRKKMIIFWRNRQLRDTMQRSHRQLSPIGLAKNDPLDIHCDAPVSACCPGCLQASA